jgi:hypothetical protein
VTGPRRLRWDEPAPPDLFDHINQEDTMPTKCSYCAQAAKYMGDGQDGDFYCERHKSRASTSVIALSEIDD